MIETKKCSHCKECCRNSKCIHHFIQDRDVSTGLLNSYKVALILKGLPVEIIDRMVNDFLDVREKCKYCRRIFSSLSESEHTGIALQCNSCRKYLCGNCGVIDRYMSTYDVCSDCCNSAGDFEDYYEGAFDDDDDDYGSDYFYGGSDNISEGSYYE